MTGIQYKYYLHIGRHLAKPRQFHLYSTKFITGGTFNIEQAWTVLFVILFTDTQQFPS